LIKTLGSVAMRCYSHLPDDEGEQIGLAKALGHSIGAIAQAIGHPKSTVWRELSRNRLPSGRYSPLHAAEADRKRSSLTDLRCRPARGRWAPEQISGWLKGGNEPDLRAVGCETIYAFIYPHAPAQTPPPAPIETFARYHLAPESRRLLHRHRFRKIARLIDVGVP
jgi:IS30 family transposase